MLPVTAENEFGAHNPAAVAPVTFVNEPIGTWLQTVAPMVEEYEPAGHSFMYVAPIDVTNEPGAEAMQAVAPTTDEYVPATHRVKPDEADPEE